MRRITKVAIVGGAVALALVVVGAIGASHFQHVHAMYRFVIADALAPCADGNVTREVFPAAHVHAPALDVLHSEGRIEEGTLGNAFAHAFRGELADDAMTLHVAPGCDGTFVANATQPLVLVRDRLDGVWAPIPKPFAAARIEDRTRMLILYGNASVAHETGWELGYPGWDGPTSRSIFQR